MPKPGNLPPIPVGIETLLGLAACDPRFRNLLLDGRSDAARAAEVRLSASERSILDSVSRRQLAAMIDRVPSPPPQRRDFLQHAAASAVVALGGAALTSCDLLVRGSRSDMPAERLDSGAGNAAGDGSSRPDRAPVPQGIAPDMPPERERIEEQMPPTGITPDLPPERPPERPRPKQYPRPTGIAPDLPPEPRPRDQKTAPQVNAGASSDRPGPPQRPRKPPPQCRAGSMEDSIED